MMTKLFNTDEVFETFSQIKHELVPFKVGSLYVSMINGKTYMLLQVSATEYALHLVTKGKVSVKDYISLGDEKFVAYTLAQNYTPAEL